MLIILLIKYGLSDGVIDGYAEIYDTNDDSHYMLVNQIEEDDFGNVWVVNPFCESEGHILAVQSYIDDSWSHVMTPNETSYRPQTVALQSMGDQQRIWLGFANGDKLDGSDVYSEGGLKVMNSSGIFSSEWDTNWVSISNPSLLPGDAAAVLHTVRDRQRHAALRRPRDPPLHELGAHPNQPGLRALHRHPVFDGYGTP